MLKAKYAILIDKFNLRPWEIGRLTPRQVEELYFHPRDKDGQIKITGEAQPQGFDPATMTNAQKRQALIMQWDSLLSCGMMKRVDYDAARKQLDEKYPEEKASQE